MSSSSSTKSNVLLWIFVASGFSGLIYQSIWSHYIGLILGHSAYAQTLVLALFMGGMALGAWIISRKSSLLKNPLLIYAVIELIIGVFGIVFHSYYLSISNWSYANFFPLLSSGTPLELGRWLIASALILPQCILLGMTFPLMSAAYIRWQPDASGRVLAGLYFTNSLGAAIGALASTYLLLPTVGLPGAILTAGLINIIIAILIWPLSKKEQPFIIIKKEFKNKQTTTPIFILGVAAITGATSFIYEISWIRMLSMVLGSTIHAFEVMLAAFILGIAFGGWWLKDRADRIISANAGAGWAQIAMGFAAISTLFLYNSSFEWVSWLLQTINRTSESGYSVYNIASAFISMSIMFPTAFFAGMTLPLLTLSLLRQNFGEAAIGKVYAANTLGAILGVIFAVFVGLPFLGLRVSIWLAAAIDVALGLFLLAGVWKTTAPKFRILWLSGATTCGLIAALLFSQFNPSLMSSGVFRNGTLVKQGMPVLFQQDGRTASIIVNEYADRGQRSIRTNGKPDAAITINDNFPPAQDERTMASLAIVPMLLQPQAKHVGIIGFGSGMTTHFVLGNPDIERVDTIEIEPAMVAGAKFFEQRVKRAFEDPRSHIIIDDAKSYFGANRQKYDIIISEPSNPWVSGVASLFSQEFYKFAPLHLNKDGIFVQWIQIYEINTPLVISIFKAMQPYFEDIQMYQGHDNDLIVVGSPHKKLPLVSSLSISSHWPKPIRAEMERLGYYNADDLKRTFLGDLQIFKAATQLAPAIPVNSDFFPILQLDAPKSRFNGNNATFLNEIQKSPWPILEVTTQKIPEINIPKGNKSRDSIFSTFDREYLTYSDIRQAMLKPVYSKNQYTDINTDMQINRLWSIGENCNLLDREAEFRHILTQLSMKTLAYFQPKDLEGVWIKPNWLKCKLPDSIEKDYLNLISFASLRDYTSVFKTGIPLLEKMQTGSINIQTFVYVLGWVELAAYALGDYEQVDILEQKYAKNITPDMSRWFIRQLSLDAIAEQSRPH